jgi:hypothetical protein
VCVWLFIMVFLFWLNSTKVPKEGRLIWWYISEYLSSYGSSYLDLSLHNY